MSYTDRQPGEDPYVGYRKVRARKEWPCDFHRQKLCDGTIKPGEEYIDETLAPWTPEYDADVDDEGRMVASQTGVLGSWQHTRYHEACEAQAVGHMLYGTPEEQAADERAFAKELADQDKAFAVYEAEQLARQKADSKKSRRQRELDAQAAKVTPPG